MNRADFQRLSNARIREATTLFEAGEWSGAYYLAGYAVECALKACFAKSVKRFDFPDKTSSRKIFVHNLVELVELAGLKNELLVATQTNAELESSWITVRKWTEESRYSIWSKSDAEALTGAIVRRKNGVLLWIKQRW